MLELKDVESFRKSISCISGFVGEGNIRFNDSGLHLRGVDPSQVVLVDFSMSKDAFKKFEVEPAFVGVDLTELNKIVTRVQQNESMHVEVLDSELLVVVRGEFEKSFHLPLIEASGSEVALPKLKFDARVELPAKVFREALKDASIFGSLVVLRVEKNSFFLEAKGSHGKMSCVSKESKAIKVISGKDVVAKFSLGFLQNIVRETAPEEFVVLELKADSPLKVSFSIGFNHFEFFVAHMIL